MLFGDAGAAFGQQEAARTAAAMERMISFIGEEGLLIIRADERCAPTPKKMIAMNSLCKSKELGENGRGPIFLGASMAGDFRGEHANATGIHSSHLYILQESRISTHAVFVSS